MRTITKLSLLLSLLLLNVAWLGPDRANAAADITAMIANAKTAADHEAIATYYDKEAATAKENAALHSKMLAVIKTQGGPAVAKWHMDKHCEDLVRQYESAAKMYGAMAAAHREMAQSAK